MGGQSGSLEVWLLAPSSSKIYIFVPQLSSHHPIRNVSQTASTISFVAHRNEVWVGDEGAQIHVYCAAKRTHILSFSAVQQEADKSIVGLVKGGTDLAKTFLRGSN